jgi:hypothetical protein
MRPTVQSTPLYSSTATVLLQFGHRGFASMSSTTPFLYAGLSLCSGASASGVRGRQRPALVADHVLRLTSADAFPSFVGLLILQSEPTAATRPEILTFTIRYGPSSLVRCAKVDQC